jgi:hypothetical protein
MSTRTGPSSTTPGEYRARLAGSARSLRGEGASPITADIEAIEALGVRCIAGDFAAEGDVVRHAADRVPSGLSS